MTTLFPPVLESRATAIPFSRPSGEENTFFTIPFFVPEIDDTVIALTPSAEGIKHIQVTLRYKDSGEPAVNSAFSPDNATLFIPTYFESGDRRYVYYDPNTRLCTVKIPYKLFKNKHPEKATTYLVQVRFGAQTLWIPESTDPFSGNALSFSNYAVWFANQTSTVPSNFGEWSNTQMVYCYGDAKTALTYNFDDFVPELFYEYAPEENDPLTQCKVVYEYSDITGGMGGNISKTLIVNGNAQGNGSYTARFRIPVAPIQVIYVSLEAITINGTIRNQILNIPPIGQGTSARIPELANPWIMEDTPLRGEELEDGVIAKTISGTVPESGLTVSIYRSNIFTFETTKIKEGIALNGFPIKIKDFSVEMGEDYQYIAILKKNGIAYKQLVPIMPWGINNSGHSRLMSLNSVFLDDKSHQLRIQGNISVSSFKRNTADQFQTTIGSEYPFYSRGAKTNYRSFQLSGVITINCDPTGSFLKNSRDEGLRWEDDKESKLLILNRDLFNDIEYSMSRIRIGSNNMAKHEIIEYGLEEPNDIRGPSSIYDEFKARDPQLNIEPSRTDEMVFMERKFRECVMKWLSNGKAKLFRSETEGNMIVIPSAISFSPLDKTGRIVYTVSMTLTEIAEINLENLIEYNLIPIEISTNNLKNFPTTLDIGDIISEKDYRALIYLFPEFGNGEYFDEVDGSYRLKKAEGIQEALDTINEFTFIRGNPQLPIYEKIVFINSEKFNIDKVDLDAAKLSGWVGPNFAEGVVFAPGLEHDYSISAVTSLPNWLSLDHPTGTNIWRLKITAGDSRIAPRDPVKLTFLVTDNVTHDQIYFTINTGPWYQRLVAVPEDSTGITVKTTGEDVEYRILASKGVKFNELSGNPQDLDYLFSATGLPFGLTMDPDGYIRGRIAGKQPVGGNITVTVEDAVGVSVDVNVHYGAVMYWPYINQADYFDVGYLEIGEDRGEISLIDAVVGGSGSFRFEVNGAPSGRESILVPGVEINNGKINLRPSAGAECEASQSFIINLFDTAISTTEVAATCTVILGPILEKFVFEDISSSHVLTQIKGTLPSPISGNLNMIPIGQVLEEIDILNYIEAGARVKFIKGGLPFTDENGDKYYKFSAANLYPDYNISIKGKITGRAQVSSAQRQATLFAMDARGKKIMLNNTEGSTTIAEITSTLKLINNPPNLILPQERQGTSGQADYHTEFLVEDYLIGGYNDVGQTYSFTKEGDWPSWLNITVTYDSGAGKFKVTVGQVSGQSRTVKRATSYSIKVSDHTLPSPQSLLLTVDVGAIVSDMVLTGSNALTFSPSRMMNTYSVANLSPDSKIEGGMPPYTAQAISSTSGQPMENSEYKIHQGQGAEQNPNNFYVEGIATNMDSISYGIVITDGIGQSVTLKLDDAAPAVELDYTTLVADDDTKTYLENKNLVMYVPDFLPEGSIIENNIIIRGINGFGNYVFLFNNRYENEIMPGVTFYGRDVTYSGIDRAAGSIAGRPIRVNLDPATIETEFTVVDSEGYMKSSSDHLKNHIWIPPKVYDAPRYKIKDGLQVMEESVPTVIKGTVITCEPCFTGGIGIMKHPDVKYYYGYDDNPEMTLLKDGDPIIIMQNGSVINTGLIWNENTTQLIASSGIALFDQVDIKIKAEILKNEDNLLAADYRRIFTVHFSGVKEPLMWQRYTLPPILERETLIWKVPVSTVPVIELDNYVWEIDLHDIPFVAKIVGGVGKLNFSFIDPLPSSHISSWELTTDGHLIHHYHAPTPGEPESVSQVIRIAIQDDFSTITTVIEWQGVMSPLILTLGTGYLPKIQPFNLAIGTVFNSDVIRDMSGNEFDINIQGGSNNINNIYFTFENSDPYNDLFIERDSGVFEFKSNNDERAAIKMGTKCRLERTTTLTAWDRVIDPGRTAPITKTITIGAITGGLPIYPKTEDMILSIPEGAKGSIQDINVDLNDYFDGSPAEFSLKIDPTDASYSQWESYEGSITFEIIGTNLVIRVIRPQATVEIPETSLWVELKLLSGNLRGLTTSFRLPVGRVTI